ncbi:MAG: helix-turn-helix domain-containing protein [Acidihalobacter sp.]|uniref:helix-turn-helix domain-containing protein n=1 Tax=Acidihalobacter sp. TaxID=1872108 RepID=UPI00307D5171
MDHVAIQALPDLLTTEEVADLLRIAPKTLRRSIADGSIPLRTAKAGGRRLLFRRTEVISYIDEQFGVVTTAGISEQLDSPTPARRGRGRPRLQSS